MTNWERTCADTSNKSLIQITVFSKKISDWRFRLTFDRFCCFDQLPVTDVGDEMCWWRCWWRPYVKNIIETDRLKLAWCWRQFLVATVMLVATSCWWLYDGDRLKMLVTESLFWLLFNVLNWSRISQSRHQHISSPISVMNIDEAVFNCWWHDQKMVKLVTKIQVLRNFVIPSESTLEILFLIFQKEAKSL